ncbi:MAG TPA: hypothetical protein VEX38_05990 [Fimbriimonadaceae bacterium]|nr:hypothetical protein [Fimbriimonadaceae bacterium]
MIGTIIALALLAYKPHDLTFEPYTLARTTIGLDGSILTQPLDEILHGDKSVVLGASPAASETKPRGVVVASKTSPVPKQLAAAPKNDKGPLGQLPAVHHAPNKEAQVRKADEKPKTAAVKDFAASAKLSADSAKAEERGAGSRTLTADLKTSSISWGVPHGLKVDKTKTASVQRESLALITRTMAFAPMSTPDLRVLETDTTPPVTPVNKPEDRAVEPPTTIAPDESKEPEKPAPKKPTLKKETPKSVEDTIVSLNCSDAKLNEVLDQLTELSKANLVLLSPTESKITLRLKNVRLAEMLRHITSMTGLAYLKVNNAFLIATPEKLKSAYPAEFAATFPEPVSSGGGQVTTQDTQEPVITRIYNTKYVDSSQLANAIKGMFDNQVTAVAGPAQMSLDLMQIDTSQATGVSSGSMSTGGAVARFGRTVIIRGPQRSVEDALAAAAALDTESAQVAIAVKIHDVSNDALRELGISWQWSNVTLTETDPRGMNFGSFTRNPLGFNAQIKALELENRAKLLAEPSISVIDNEKAYILVGSRLTFPVVIGFTQANTPIFNREETRVGIYLQVAPSIGANDQITLSLKPQVSVVKGYIEVNGGSYPQIDTREAQTTLRVKSGETIVMGGLIRDEDINQVERVPLLSQIPLLGELFKRRKTTKVSSQVIITITPTIIRPAQ